MRKGISILFALIVILAGARLSIATHYCCNKVAAIKVSLSGKLASCGMENTEESIPAMGNFLTSHCCDNQVINVGIINNYTSPVSNFTENTKSFLQFYYYHLSQSFYSKTVSDSFYTSIRPPGRFTVSDVDPDDICVFRI